LILYLALSGESWKLKPKIVSEAGYENALVSSIEGDIFVKIAEARKKLAMKSPNFTQEDYEAVLTSSQLNVVDKTPRALALLKGPKLDVIAYDELEKLLQNLSDDKQGKLQQRIATFLNERARAGGVVPISQSSLSSVVSFFDACTLDESTWAAFSALNGLPFA